jgi:drug/metabolite transporter (DMT)-like permease
MKAYLALAVVCIVWGTTYMALRIGVENYPPILFSGIRNAAAGIILLAILFFSGKLPRLTKKEIIPQLLPGILLVTIGNGFVGWSERYIPSGLAALIVSLMPVYVVLINFATGSESKRPSLAVIGGLVFGFAGIALIFRDNLSDFSIPGYTFGIVLCFIAVVAWASGSLIIKKRKSSTDAFTNAALQLSSGGILLLILSPFIDGYETIPSFTRAGFYALLYLTFIGSILAYNCYLYALKHLPVSIVSLYTYINPFIALLVGAIFLNESISWLSWLALASTICGVYLLTRPKSSE